MSNEYEKQLEAENTELRKSINALEDALANANKLADSKLFSIDDMRDIIVSQFDYNIPTNTIMYQGQPHHFSGRAEISMKLEFNNKEVAVRLKEAIEGAMNAK